nr:hypothetical protein [Streptomyces broussonetiae]
MAGRVVAPGALVEADGVLGEAFVVGVDGAQVFQQCQDGVPVT